jgi:type II secretory pathway component GspD/PulD (secretin)
VRTPASRTIVGTCALMVMLAAPAAAQAPQGVSQPAEGAVPIAHVIEAVAKKTGKRFLVDSRVRGDALLIGQDVARLDYPGLLAVLQILGFAAVEEDDYVHVIPDANARQQALPLATAARTHPDAQYVDKVIHVKNVPSPLLVPILRPMLPQQAHLVALPCTNRLIIVDTFANATRIEKLVQILDTGEPYTPPKCGVEVPVKCGS